ncbi:hypothetical protein D3C87_1965050 [compost metagenome]
MDLEEKLEDLAIADLGWIELDFDRFGVGAMVAIGGVVHIAAGVAHPRGQYAGLAPDQILHAPETTAGQNGLFGSRRHFAVLPISQCAH